MIELDKLYSPKEIAQELFKISPKTFSNKRQEYLDYLGQYYEYELVNRKIRLIKQIKPFQTKMQRRQKKKEQNVQIYRDLTHKIIFYKPLNSGSNIAREIDQSKNKPIKNHKESTIVSYIRPILKEDFEPTDKVWCQVDYGINKYDPLTEEQLAYLMELFRSKDLSQQILDITADYKCGNISKQEFQTKVGNASELTYDKIMDMFKRKYGFRPYKVPNWHKKGLKFG